MRNTLVLMLMLAGCPTPPESPGGGDGGAPGGGPQGGPPGGGPGGPPGGGPGGGPEGAGPPQEGGGSATGAVPGNTVLMVSLPEGARPPTPKQTQEQVKAGEHVTFSGTITCTTCDAKMVVSVSTPAPEGEMDAAAKVVMLTSAVVDKAGDFSIAVPKGDDPVVLEVLYDEDANGGPTTGERFAVVPPTAATVADEDRAGLLVDLDGTPPTGAAPSGGPPQQGTPIAQPPGDAPAGAPTEGESPPAPTPPDGSPEGGPPPSAPTEPNSQ